MMLQMQQTGNMERKKISLFEGLTEEEYGNVIERLGGTEKLHAKGDEIPVPDTRAGVLLSGRISFVKTGQDGSRTIFDQLEKNDLFGGPAGVPLGGGSFLLAEEDSCALYIEYARLTAPDGTADPSIAKVLRNLSAVLTEKIRSLSAHLEILSRRTTRGKLLAYFSFLAAETGSTRFSIPFSQTSLADYLCVDRSAMLREIRVMKEEGLLEMDRRTVRILNAPL